MTTFDKEHGILYAENATKIFMFEKFSRLYPNLFKHAILETRPADSSKDYYVPPALADRCLVVHKLAWTERGCRYVACFPYTEKMEPCQENDPMTWIRLGFRDYGLGCQPACTKGMTRDTVFRNGECFEANAYKKFFVMFPETYNGMVAKHARLELVDDHLALSERYCRHYVLLFRDGDCWLNDAQYYTELIFGTTFFRNIARKKHRPKKPPSPPPLPVDEFENAWERAVSRNKRAQDDDLSKSIDAVLNKNDVDYAQLVQEIVAELSIDYGIQISATVVRKFLDTYAPRMLGRMAASVSVKYAFVNMFLKIQISTLLRTSKAIQTVLTGVRTTASVASMVFLLQGVVSLFLDVFDPYEYGKVLYKKQVDEIDKILDLKYFQSFSHQNIAITPEDVWMDLLKEELLLEREQDKNDDGDENMLSEMIMYFSERYEEYMAQIHDTNKTNLETKPLAPSVSGIRRLNEHDVPLRDCRPHWIVIVGIFAASLLFLKYIEYFAFVLFGIFLVSQYV